MITAVLIDSLSIQQYIFSSNKLREQIGASFIVEKLIFNECIPLALQQIFLLQAKPNVTNWEQSPNLKILENDESQQFEVGYIGGGNALVLFRDFSKAKEFINAHTFLLLQYFPGIKTAYAIDDNFKYEDSGYRDCRRRLSEQLIQNRNFHTTFTVPFKPGIADDCDFSGEAKEDKVLSNEEEEEKKFISGTTFAKNSYENEAITYLREELLDGLISNESPYTFTNNQEKLGQPDEKGYLAIIHADGNGMGKEFLNAASLEATRKLSAGTKQYAKKVMQKIMGDVLEVITKDKEKGDKNRTWKLQTDKKTKKEILPIRPIIAGGDDITFVCEGRLGIYLAERLLQHMTEVDIAGHKIQACAGVVLVHSKFPFYKAYTLCEEVTKEAKDCSREKGTSWIHYHLSTGGFSGGFKDVIKQEFTVPTKGNLRYGPYVVNDKDNTKSFQNLKSRIKEFSSNWPRNKAKEFRDVLRKSDADQQYFKTALSVHRDGEKMQKIFHGNAGNFWIEKIEEGKNESEQKVYETPYFDAIELLEFYPVELIK